MCDFGVSQVLVYYSHIPVLIICFLLGLFIYHANAKSSVNRNLFIFILFFCFWITNDLAQWIITDPNINLFLARISIIEAISLIFFLFAIFALTRRKVTNKIKIFLFFIFSPLAIFMFTEYNAYLVDGDQCNLQFGALYWYLYVFMLIILGYVLFLLISQYRRLATDEKTKSQIKIIIGAFSFFVLWFIFIMVLTWLFVITKNPLGDKVFLFTPFGMVVFSSMIAYAITKYQFLNIRSIAAQLLTYTIWILIGSQYFFVTSIINIMLVTSTLILSVIFGSMLIYTIRMEIRQKKELEIANEKLRALDQIKSEFISMASHQLRTPLTTMKGFVSLIKNGSYGPLSENFLEPVQYIETANDRLITLVEDMLNVSQIETGRMVFDFKLENINELVEEIFQSFTVIAHKENIALELKKSPRMPAVMMDYGKMRETISNIVDNAIKYTEKGSVKIETKKKEKVIQVIVTDTGMGIEKAGFKFLFDKFSRGEKAQKVKKNGVGLGLYLGKKIMEEHRGKIFAKSAGKDKGSTFIVELPLPKK